MLNYKTATHRFSLRDQLMGLMISSTRPVQAIMAVCGLVAAAGLWAAQSLNTWTPMDYMVSVTSYAFIMSLFILYSIGSWISCVLNFRHQPYIFIKYASTITGILLWTICLASSIQWSAAGLVLRDGMSFLYTIPCSADVWVLVQMIAGVEKLERRAWK